jgi:nucleoside phosphorylase
MAGTLVVAAAAEELVGAGDLAREGVRVAVVGIGAVDAAAGMAALLALDPPDRAILVGTCGEYGGARIGRLVAVERAVWVDTSTGMEIPEPVRREARADAATCAWIAASTRAERVVAACPAGVTIDDGAAARIAASTGATVEHMECFAVLRACELAAVPAVALLAVANRVGRGARDAWRAHRAEAERAAVTAVTRALQAGGGAGAQSTEH